MIHFFKNSITTIKLPDKFTYPFHYTPHPLCIIATKEVQAYLTSQSQWQKELQQGKMFGVLIVQTPENKIGYLAAFSGTLAGKNCHPFFVPPIYDLLQPQGFFKIEEKRISAINVCIKKTQNDPRYIDLLRQIEKEKIQSQQELTEAKEFFKSAKKNREIRRKTGIPDAKELAAMIRESQFQKAELKRMEKIWKEKIASLQAEADTFITKIETMKIERKKRSATLQRKLFEQFQILNAHGETKDLCRIFAQTIQKFPPAGAGECAAPKLLQYAYKHQLKPIAMAEFWWGDSPKAEIRHHGYYYPACKGKCGPILGHMLQGLEVEENPLLKKHYHEMPLEIVYEDNYLVVINKPAGMLSVPGKGEIDSVYQHIKILYPDATGPLIVHRLDMATSGVLLIAKNKEVHQHLQAQFKNRMIKKRYIALLDGKISSKEGTIILPLRMDPLDRPRQVVDHEHGKTAIMVIAVLKKIGCQPETNEEGHIVFKYQGDDFYIAVEDEARFIMIWNPWWASISMDNPALPYLKEIVNLVNVDSLVTTVFTADEDEKNVGLHSKCHTVFTPKEGQLDEYLKAMLDHFFVTHDAIKQNLQQLGSAASESANKERTKVKGFAAYKENSTPLSSVEEEKK